MKLVEVLLFAAALALAQTRLPAELAPYQKVTIMARVSGMVQKVAVDRGSPVKEGDVLVELSAPELAAQIAEARARVEASAARKAEAEAKVGAAEATLERLLAASKTQGAVAENDIVQARKALDAARGAVASIEKEAAAAEAAVLSLEALAALLTIRAPFSGIITARFAHPGAVVSPGSGALLELEQVSRLRCVAAVPESEYGRIKPGQRLEFTVAAYPEKKFVGTVARSSKSLNPKTRTMPVELDVANPAGELAPGMYAEVLLPAPMKQSQ
jgi:RND family efflux transporter MFP subunit